jgi:6-phosphogluconolactonase
MAHARQIVPPEQWAATATEVIAQLIRDAVEARGVCHLALAGGGTPGPIYQRLATTELPWKQVEIWFGDERCVPPDHADSNYRMAKELLLKHIPATVHRMRGEDPDREAAARDYAQALPDHLDVVLLGMGGDGHTASLFPGQHPTGQVAVVNGPKPPPWRLTLTDAVIGEARDSVVLVTGENKAARIHEALYGPPNALPIQIAREGTWILDTGAGSIVGRIDG